MTKFRIGHMLLMERVARLLGVPAQTGVCALCQIPPESTQDFLQKCYSFFIFIFIFFIFFFIFFYFLVFIYFILFFLDNNCFSRKAYI